MHQAHENGKLSSLGLLRLLAVGLPQVTGTGLGMVPLAAGLVAVSLAAFTRFTNPGLVPERRGGLLPLGGCI